MVHDAFRRSAGLIDLSNRGKLQFKGEQAHWFLDQLLTNKIEGLEAGEGADALLLTPRGRITAIMRCLSSGKSVFVDTDPGAATGLKAFFEGRVFATKVSIADRTQEFGLLRLLGPRADVFGRAALERYVIGESEEDRALGASVPSDREHHTTHFGSVALVRVTRPVSGIDLWVRAASTGALSELLAQEGAVALSETEHAELEAVEGLPRSGVDFDDGYLPQEAALERCVRFDKGCYLGQEAVAMTQRGRVQRRLRRVVFDGEPFLGTLMSEGNLVGKVTSVGAEAGTGYGIATVKTSVELGATVEVVSEASRSTARIEELPGTSSGPEVPSARQLRERLTKGS